jgi:hypothetical protein
MEGGHQHRTLAHEYVRYASREVSWLVRHSLRGIAAAHRTHCSTGPQDQPQPAVDQCHVFCGDPYWLFRIEPMGRFPTPWSVKGCGSLGLGAWSSWWARRTPIHPGAGEPVIEPGGGVDVTDEAP